MKKWFSSDLHFGDDRFDLFYRPFENIKEQHQVIIDNWNKIVKKEDEVWLIGDISVTDEHVSLLDKLNGIKHLIIGNYDEPRLELLRPYFESMQIEGVVQLSIGKNVYLNHYPSKCVDSLFCLTGHIHGLWKVQRNMINVSCDAWHFTPVSEEQIIFAMNAVDKFYDDNVFAGELDCNLIKMDGLEVYAEDEIPKAGKKVFLAGSTPRSLDVQSWRPQMIQELRKSGYREHILIPEKKNREDGYDYDTQVEWEDKALNAVDLIVFWVPKNLDSMPGFTTNIEFGEWMKSGKVILGYPEQAYGMRYMNKKAVKYRIPTFGSMDDVCECVMEWLYE